MIAEKTSEAEILEAIRRALTGLRYGSIEVVVHDSKVVQIERTEKVRLQQPVQSPSDESRRAAINGHVR